MSFLFFFCEKIGYPNRAPCSYTSIHLLNWIWDCNSCGFLYIELQREKRGNGTTTNWAAPSSKAKKAPSAEQKWQEKELLCGEWPACPTSNTSTSQLLCCALLLKSLLRQSLLLAATLKLLDSSGQTANVASEVCAYFGCFFLSLEISKEFFLIVILCLLWCFIKFTSWYQLYQESCWSLPKGLNMEWRVLNAFSFFFISDWIFQQGHLKYF